MKRLNSPYQRLRDFEAIGDEALLKVVDGAQVQCMLSVNAIAQGLIARAHDEFGARLHLITIDDPKVSRPLRQANGELRPLYRPHLCAQEHLPHHAHRPPQDQHG